MNESNPDELDSQDMAQLAAGQDAALNRLMQRHAERLFHYLLRSLQNEADAADLAQETFVRVYENRAKFDPARKFSIWLYAIASNLVRDRFRWRSRHPDVSLEAGREETETELRHALPSQEASPDQVLQAQEQSEAVRKAIAALPPDLRQALILATYEEAPQAEIAAILGCSVKAVETRIYRARQRLRAELSSLLGGG